MKIFSRSSSVIVREMLTFHRSATEIGSMLRCSIGVALAFLLAWRTNHQSAGPIMAVGAFICGFISLEGIYRSRIKLILATAAGIAASSFIGETALNSLPALVLLTALVGYVNGVFAQVSRLAGAVALYTSVTFIVFSHQPLSLEASLTQSGFLLCGAAIQIVLLVLSYPLSRFTIERKALQAAFQELSNFSDASTGEYKKAPPAAMLIAARQVLADPQPFARARDIARFKRLLHDVHVLRNRIAGLHALQNVITAEQKSAQSAFLGACTEQLRVVATMLAGRMAHHEAGEDNAATRQALELFEAAFVDDGLALTIARSTIVHLRDAIQGASVIATGRFSRFLFVASARPGQYIETRVNWRSREALRLALVLSVAMFLGHTVFASGRGYWIALTSALILKPDLRSTFVRGFSRIGGTIIGAVLATLLMALHPSSFWLAAGMIAFGAICYATFLANYGLFTIAVTAFVIFFLALIGLPSDSSIAARVLDTLIGGSLAMLGYLCLPTWSHKRTREVLADLIETQAQFAAAVLQAYIRHGAVNSDVLERIRTRAWKLRIDAESLVDRARTEPELSHSIGAERALDILAATQSFALVNLAMESGLESVIPIPAHEHVETFRAALAAELTEIANALRQNHNIESDSALDALYQIAEENAQGETAMHGFLRVHCVGYAQSVAALRRLCNTPPYDMQIGNACQETEQAKDASSYKVRP